MIMRVLVACEMSGIVRDEFLKLGHDAISCDLQDSLLPGPHIKADIFSIINDGWDLLLAYPPCTYLCNSGVRWLYERKGRIIDMGYAIEFFNNLLDCDIPKKCIENPIQHMIAQKLIKRRPSQVIQPYQFGHPETKATCLWLENLPKLEETNNVKEQMLLLPKSERNRIHFATGMTRENRSIMRSLTYPNIAKAKAEQWGGELKTKGFGL